MFVINDLGLEMLNADNAFSFMVAPTPDGAAALLAFGVMANQNGPIHMTLAVGSKERCEQAMAAISKGIKDRQHVVDLLGLLGQRPDISVPRPQIVLPGNGEGHA